MKNVLIGLCYAVGIIITEILVITAWYCSPLVIDFDASPIVLCTVILLPVVSACAATRNTNDKLVEKGILMGIILWCLMMLLICCSLSMLISKKLLIVSLLMYIILSVGSSLCSANIRSLHGTNKMKKNAAKENWFI